MKTTFIFEQLLNRDNSRIFVAKLWLDQRSSQALSFVYANFLHLPGVSLTEIYPQNTDVSFVARDWIRVRETWQIFVFFSLLISVFPLVS